MPKYHMLKIPLREWNIPNFFWVWNFWSSSISQLNYWIQIYEKPSETLATFSSLPPLSYSLFLFHSELPWLRNLFSQLELRFSLSIWFGSILLFSSRFFSFVCCDALVCSLGIFFASIIRSELAPSDPPKQEVWQGQGGIRLVLEAVMWLLRVLGALISRCIFRFGSSSLPI